MFHDRIKMFSKQNQPSLQTVVEDDAIGLREGNREHEGDSEVGKEKAGRGRRRRRKIGRGGGGGKEETKREEKCSEPILMFKCAPPPIHMSKS